MPALHRQIAANLRNGLLRPGADPTYADGDDATWMSVDWPSMLHDVHIDGRRINVLDTGPPDLPPRGDRKAILWIHGLSGRWQNWLLNIPQFMKTHRCIALDLPGFGESELPAGEISIREYGRIVDQLCVELGVDCPTVVGNSMGGFIGAEVALSYPTRVAKLVLVSAAGLSVEYLRREPLLALARLTTYVTAREAAHLDFVVRRPRLRRAALQAVVRYPEKLSPALAYELASGTGKPGFLAALEALMSYSFRDRLVQIEAPVLIVWGENDMIVPAGDAARFERLIGANARKVLFHDTGHVPMIERPSRFNGLLREFLAGAEAPEERVPGVHA
jgi:pimeloyl-ACP methyl ester carboxylesterase